MLRPRDSFFLFFHSRLVGLYLEFLKFFPTIFQIDSFLEESCLDMFANNAKSIFLCFYPLESSVFFLRDAHNK